MSSAPATQPSDSPGKPVPGPGAGPASVLTLLLAYSFLSWFNRVSMSVAGAEQIIPGGLLNETRMGDIYSILVVTYTLCMIPGGWLADRAGPRTALLLMGLGSAAFVAMTGVAGGIMVAGTGLYVGLLAARGLMGAFTAPIYPAAGRVVSLEVPAHRLAEANGLIMGAALVGIAAAPFAFGQLIDWFRWPSAFVVMGLVTAALAIAWAMATARRPLKEFDSDALHPLWDTHLDAGTSSVAAGADPTLSLGRLLGQRSLLFLALAYVFIGYYENLFFFWSQYYFKDVMELGKNTSRAYTTLLYLAMALGMFAGGRLADRLGRSTGVRTARLLVAAAGLLAGAVFLSVALSAGLNQPRLVVGSLALALAAVGICEGPLWTMAIEAGGRRGATAGAIFNTGGNFGGVFSPAVTPRVATAFGWTCAVGLGVAACVIAVIFLAFVEREPKSVTERGGEFQPRIGHDDLVTAGENPPQ